MVILEVRTPIPKNEDEAAHMVGFIDTRMCNLVAFCYRNQEKLFDPETRSFYD